MYLVTSHYCYALGSLMNNLPNLSVQGKDGSLNLIIHEKTNDTSNQGSIKIGDYAGKDFMSRRLSRLGGSTDIITRPGTRNCVYVTLS